MMANSPAFLAAAFSSSSSPTALGDSRCAAMPEPTTTAARKALPSSSASSRRHSATSFTADRPGPQEQCSSGALRPSGRLTGIDVTSIGFTLITVNVRWDGGWPQYPDDPAEHRRRRVVRPADHGPAAVGSRRGGARRGAGRSGGYKRGKWTWWRIVPDRLTAVRQALGGT